MNPNLIEDESELASIVRGMRTIAVVGIKDGSRPDAPAFTIPAMLEEMGYEITGINPTITAAFGQPTLATVADLGRPVDVLDVFRRIDAIPGLADELLALPAGLRPAVVWLQSGIRHDDAAGRLAAAGIRVVQDRCLGVYARRYR